MLLSCLVDCEMQLNTAQTYIHTDACGRPTSHTGYDGTCYFPLTFIEVQKTAENAASRTGQATIYEIVHDYLGQATSCLLDMTWLLLPVGWRPSTLFGHIEENLEEFAAMAARCQSEGRKKLKVERVG